MARRRSTYWRGFLPLAAGSLGLLLLFVFGLMPQRFLLDLDFAESGFAYPVVLPPLPLPTTAMTSPPPLTARRPVARGPAERLWAEYTALVEAGNLEAALQMLEEYTRRHPEDLDAMLEYARAQWRVGRLDAAVESYRKVLAHGATPQVRLEFARLLVALQRWDAAVAEYEQMIADSPADMVLLREYARTLTWAERYEEALAVYAKLVEASPDDLELLREYAAVATWGAQYDVALAVFARLVELAPDDPELRIEWARVLLWAFQPEAAAEVLAGLPADFTSPAVDSLRIAIEEAMPVMSETGESLLDQARALAWTAEADSALSLYRLYLSEHPEADSVLLEMADLFQYRVDARDSAMAYLSTYLLRHPDAEVVQLRLAWLLAWSGRYYEAETMARSILADNPENAEAWVLLGDLYRWQGERKRSREAYRRALEADPWVVGAAEGLAALEEQRDTQLAARGTIGAAGGLETFADNDDFSLLRLRGGWVGGSPETRAGVEMSIERLRGLDGGGENAEFFAFAVEGAAQKWFFDGEASARLTAGAWIPDGGGSSQPTVGLSVEAPDWGGGAYRFEYLHAPGHREAVTLEAAEAGLRTDAVSAEVYRPLTDPWDISALARATIFSGVGDANLRLDAGVGFFHKMNDRWTLGYQTRALAFRDPAPDLGRRLYWDPKWSWSNLAVVSWRSAPTSGWEFGAWLSPGVAWLHERDRDPTVVAEFSAILDARRQMGVWTLEGQAVFGQSRADGYRSFGLELSASRTFGQ